MKNVPRRKYLWMIADSEFTISQLILNWESLNQFGHRLSKLNLQRRDRGFNVGGWGVGGEYGDGCEDEIGRRD